MSGLEQEVQRHGTMYLVSSTGITLIGFFATVFYAHWIGAGVLGQYFLFISYFAIAGLFTDLGIGYAAIYRICEGTDPDEYFSASLVIRTLLWGIVSLMLVVFSDNFGALNQMGLLWIFIAILFIATLGSSLGIAISASNRLGLVASANLIDNITRIIIQVIAVFLGFQLFGLIGGLAFGLLTEIIIFMRFVDYSLKKFSLSHIRRIFTFSSWAFLSTICTSLFDNANPIIIAFFLPLSDVGIFGVCWTFSAFALFISTALCSTLFVKVSRWKAAGNWDAITTSFSRATTYALILAIPMLIGGAILGQRLLYYLYGSSFAGGATALVIILGARMVQSLYLIYSNFLMATDHVKDQFIGLSVGIGANVLLAFVLVPLIGLPGAALASLVNVSISAVICGHYLRKVFPIHFDTKTLRDILLSAGIMTVILLAADQFPLKQSAVTTGAMVAIGAAVYISVLLFINAQLRGDIAQILKIRWIQ